MAMRQGTQDLKIALANDQGLTAEQTPPNDIDEVGGQVRKVSERLVLDLSVLAVRAAQEVRLVGLALISPYCRGYVNCAISAWHSEISIIISDRCKRKLAILVATL